VDECKPLRAVAPAPLRLIGLCIPSGRASKKGLCFLDPSYTSSSKSPKWTRGNAENHTCAGNGGAMEAVTTALRLGVIENKHSTDVESTNRACPFI